MKRIVIASAIAASMLAGVAQAQAPITVGIGGSVPTVCSVSTSVTTVSLGTVPLTITGALGTISAQTVSFSGYCNVTNSLTLARTVLTGPAAVSGFNNIIRYNATLTSENSAAINIPQTDAVSPQSAAQSSRPAFNNGATLVLNNFVTPVAAQPVLAGAYAGAVTVTLSP